MKGLVITTDNKVRIEDYGNPLFKTVGQTVGGYIEIVHPRYLPRPYMLVINEEGKLIGLPVNKTGSILYGCGIDHGEPIVGDLVIMKDGFVNGEPDIVGLDDDDIPSILELLGKIEKLGAFFLDYEEGLK